MASEVEVERLLVRLLGDGSQFQRMLMTAQTSAQSSMVAIQRMSLNIEGYQKSIEGFARTAGSALASYGIIEWLRGARQAFEEFELVTLKLNNSIRMNGGDVEKLTKDYGEFAKAISQVTNTSKGEVTQMLARLETQGISGDMAKAAVKNTMALGAAAIHVRGSWQTMHAAIALAQGNMHQAAHLLGIDMKKFKDESALTVEVQRKLANGWELAQIQAQTNSAVWKRLTNTFKELKLEIGKVLSEQMKPLLMVAQQLADMFKVVDDATKGIIVRLGVMIASSLTLRPILMFILRPLTDLITGFLAFSLSLVTTTLRLGALVVAKTISIGIWGAYTAAVIAAQTAVFIFSAGVTVATTALGLLSVGFVALGIVAFGVWKTFEGMSSRFGELVEHATTLKAVSNPFTGWSYTLETVLDLMKRDLPNALGLITLQFNVTWAKIKDAAGPVWTFIKSSASAVWEYIAAALKFHLNAAWAFILQKIQTGITMAGDFVIETVEGWGKTWVKVMGFGTISIAKYILDTFSKISIWELMTTGVTGIGALASKLEGGVLTAVAQAEAKIGSTGAASRLGLGLGLKTGKALVDEIARSVTASSPEVMKKIAEKLETDLSSAREAFKILPSEETKKAVQALEDELFKIRNQPGGLDFIGPLAPKLMNKALETGTGIGAALLKGFKSVKVQAAIYGSAEALAEFTEFQQTLAAQVAGLKESGNPNVTVPTYPKMDAVESSSAAAVTEMQQANMFLRDILKQLQDSGTGGIKVSAAGIAGGR